MFSGQCFGEAAFSEQANSSPDSDAFQAFLSEVTSERCWLLEVDALSLASVGALSAAFSDSAFGEVGFSEGAPSFAGGLTTLRFSTHGYSTHATDNPSRAWYEGRLSEKPVVDRRITSSSQIGGLSTVFAEAQLINADGALDTLTSNYALDGRPARILFGRATDALSSFGFYATGVVSAVVIGIDALQIKLSDGQAKLANPANTTTYLGTGGLEGGADLKGKYKPKGYGHVFGISPPCVDTLNLIYQVNDGAISDVPQVYDRGVLLTKVAGAPAPGEYQVTAATGTFKLGATPAGTITCNALLDAGLTGYIDRTSDIVLRMLVQQAGLITAEIEPASFSQLTADAPAEVGSWAGIEGRTVADMVDELLANVGAFGGFNRQGAFSVAVLSAASGAPKAALTEEDIIDIKREPLPALVDPIAWRVSVGYQKNYTVQSDLASTVPIAQTMFASQPVRTSTSEDLAIKSRHLLAKELTDATGLFAQSADAVTETLRRFALWGSDRKLFRVKTRPTALTRDAGQVVSLQHRRHGLALGVSGRVIGHRVQGSEVELMVLV